MLISSLSAWKQFSLAVSIEGSDFSSQLYFFLTKIKTKSRVLIVCDVIIVAVQQKVPMASNIIPYKEMSSLYLLYGCSPHNLSSIQENLGKIIKIKCKARLYLLQEYFLEI